MSWTGLDLRERARRRLARALDHLADRVDPRTETLSEGDPAPEPPREAPPTPTPSSAPPEALPPLPDRTLRDPAEGIASAQAPTPKPTPKPTPSGTATPAGERASESAEARQAKHWARTREGLLRFVDEQGGTASLRELHEHSERTYFVAHVQFSRMMEELTDEGLLDYDEDTASAALSDAGRAELAAC